MHFSGEETDFENNKPFLRVRIFSSSPNKPIIHSQGHQLFSLPIKKRENEKMKSRVMYVEYKGDGLAGTAWITRVSNPFHSPRFRLSGSEMHQPNAFAFGIP